MKTRSAPFALASILASTSVNAFSDFKNMSFIGLGVSSGRDVLYYKNMPTFEKPNTNVYAEIGQKIEFENKFFLVQGLVLAHSKKWRCMI